MINPQQQDIKKTFKEFFNLKVLVIGDAMLDTYVWGKVNRLSPEAPVPVVAVTKKESRPGGAANVALNIQALGATPILCSIIGDDDTGKEFSEVLKRKKINTEGLVKLNKRVTTVKSRVMGNNHQLLRIDEEIEENLTKAEEQKILSKLKALLKQSPDVMIIEDYNKGMLTPVVIKELISLANKKNIPVVVDPKKDNFFAYTNVSLFKPNLKELKEGMKINFDDINETTLKKACLSLKRKLKADTIMVTLSEKGIFIYGDSFKGIIPAHHRNITDVSGAGDSVISVAALCVALKLPLDLMASLSNLAGGLVCEQVGVVPIDRQLLFQESITL